jgi:hypothetical protein
MLLTTKHGQEQVSFDSTDMKDTVETCSSVSYRVLEAVEGRIFANIAAEKKMGFY